MFADGARAVSKSSSGTAVKGEALPLNNINTPAMSTETGESGAPPEGVRATKEMY